MPPITPGGLWERWTLVSNNPWQVMGEVSTLPPITPRGLSERCHPRHQYPLGDIREVSPCPRYPLGGYPRGVPLSPISTRGISVRCPLISNILLGISIGQTLAYFRLIFLNISIHATNFLKVKDSLADFS